MCRHPIGLAALAIAGGACFEPSVYACRDPTGCDAGVCEPRGYCSYPDDGCGSGRRYSSLAGEGLAGTCVDADEPGTTTTATGSIGTQREEGGSTSSETSAASDPVCGNGVLEGEEGCDDGNDRSADGCSPECVVSGTPIWETVLAGEAGLDDRVWALALLAPADVVIAGLQGTDAEETQAYYARIDGTDGRVVWSQEYGAPQGESRWARAVTVDFSNDIVVGGGEPAWLRKVDGDGNTLWDATPDIGGIRDLAPDAGGVIVAGSERRAEDGVQQALALRVGTDGQQFWRAALPEAGGFNGVVRIGSDQALLSAGMGPDHALVRGGAGGFEILSVIEAVNVGDDRAQGIDALDADTAVLGGYVNTVDGSDWWIGVFDGATRRWDAAATFSGVPLSDEFEDVAFLPDGSVVGVGLITNADKDIWVATFSPQGEMIWSRVLPEDNRGDDVARAVVVAPDGTIVVAGETTVEESRDSWIAKLVP